MQYRTLGRTGIRVSEIGFGGWGLGGGWGTHDPALAKAALEAAFEAGITFYDTAYGYGDSEKILGEVFRGRRDQVVIASKVPPKTFQWPVYDDEPIETTFPADWIIACTEETLRRLGTDYLDVQQLHAWADAYTYRDEWFEALTRLRDQGKIRSFGVSANDWDPYNTVNLVASGRCDTVQVIYNLFEQRPAERLLPAALEHHVGIIARVPLEEGLLTGKIRPGHVFEEGDWRAEWLTPERLAAVEPRLKALEAELTPPYTSLPTLALKFILSHPAVSTVIPGMRHPAHVAENAAVSDLPPLPPDLLARLQQHRFIHGWAYPWAQPARGSR
jgi:aryl-alcohol dehydrogenase-like predicted oxidoreductase